VEDRQEHSVNVNGVDVRYYATGTSDGRPPVILVHGTAGNVDRHFGYLFPSLGLRQRVIALDLGDPGYELTVDGLVDQVIAVIDAELADAPVTLVGYSLGAVIAAAAAARLGARAANLVLVAGWVKTDVHQAFRNRVWRTLVKEGSSALRESMAFQFFSPAFMAMRSVDDMAAIAATIEISPFVERQMDLKARVDISGILPAITAQTLVVACEHDIMVPPRHSKLLFGGIRNARYTEVPSGHGIMLERPAELVHLIDSFTRNPAAHPPGTVIPAQQP
jgi:pimeloyl-ACP methyl ester carboxylesterase